MEIKLVHNSPENSLFGKNSVKNMALPPPFKKMLLDFLFATAGYKDKEGKIKGFVLTHTPEESLIELDSSYQIISIWAERDTVFRAKRKKVLESFLRVMELYVWRESRHFISQDSTKIGSPSTCAHCGELKKTPGPYCDSWNCPSHEKWSQIIGEEYIAPPKSNWGINLKSVKI